MGLEETDDLLEDRMEKLDTPNKEEKPTKSFNHNQAKEFLHKKKDIVITGIQRSGEIFIVKSLHLYNAASRNSSWLG